MNYNQLSVFFTAAFLAGCNSHATSESTGTPISKPGQTQGESSAQTARTLALTHQQIKHLDVSTLTFEAPGVSVQTADQVSQIKTNFGRSSVDPATGLFVFQPYAAQVALKQADTHPVSLQASALQYHFEIRYQVDGVAYQVSGYALPQHQQADQTFVPRYLKVDTEGQVLSPDEQVMTLAKTDWSCVQDAQTGLTWQTLQASGEFAFDSSFYWGDRSQNHRDFAQASCGLTGTCNTDSLVAAANQQQLCGKSDWRLPTRNEWKTILFQQLTDEAQRLSPIDSFYFPFVDANYDEAYWTGTFTQYANGHDADATPGDWQGSNATVGDAHVMWMSSDFADDRMPPRSTNEPRLAMLVSGAVIADDADNSIEEVTATLKPEINAAGDEDAKWQNRFVKNGASGQPLVDQSAQTWACTTDTYFASEVPNTQILWQRVDKDLPGMTFEQARSYVDTINAATLCGRNDWRLPTETELKSILMDSFAFDMEGISYRAGYVNSIFNDTVVEENSYYWTQTVDEYEPENKHWAVAFQSEWAESSGEMNSSLYRVRLISTSVKQQ
ncbi:DUF1566 domain-containing protein [Photobacterium sp. MCCC 1A19761]|uniref:Lcl C-terminal domain-containing protein n=1 Tax=Photobacterium sp. MCCC 1A19761 TaxID=3115000 RepID=UPI00307CE45C